MKTYCRGLFEEPVYLCANITMLQQFIFKIISSRQFRDFSGIKYEMIIGKVFQSVSTHSSLTSSNVTHEKSTLFYQNKK